jgi:hypothetical protein
VQSAAPLSWRSSGFRGSDGRSAILPNEWQTRRVEAATVVALTPYLRREIRGASRPAAKLVELKKVSSSWDQRSFIEKGGGATMPRSDKPNSAVADACAEELGKVT